MSVGGTARTVLGWFALLGLLGLAAPAAADEGSFGCTVLAGTEIAWPEGGPIAISGTSPGGGAGECELHTIEQRSMITSLDTPDGCDVYADTDSDLFVEESVTKGQVHSGGTSFIAFCDAGVVMADNGVTLTDI